MPTGQVLRVLVVDDEQPARARLRQMLGAYDDLDIVGEAEDGEQAIERIAELAPHLVFLDIQMPGCSGLEVAASLPSPRPHIIFCTAYDEYAVDAFELHALDYLLKPVSRARLERTLARVRTPAGPDFETSFGRATPSLAHPTRFLAKHGTRFCVVPQHEVLYFASDGGLTKLQTVAQHYWMQPTLNDLEARLDPARFCRISRAAIVSLDAVREVRPLPGGHGELRLSTGTIIEISRRRLKGLLERLGG